jgi:hypothetical protein
MLPCGEKLWWVGRLKKGVDPLRGDLRSRHAFLDFNGWESMTELYDFELLHLNRYTTL